MESISNTIGQKWWTLQRFGFSPTKIVYRVSNQNQPKILCISIPKAGTHLVERILCLYPRFYRTLIPTINPSNIEKYGGLDSIFTKQRPGQILVSHLYYKPEYVRSIAKNRVKCLFIIRDPRDIVISNVFYIMREKNHHLYRAVTSRTTFQEKLQLLIAGSENEKIPPLTQFLNYFLGWLGENHLVIRFEDLVNSTMDNDAQHEALDRIYRYLQINVDKEWLETLSQRMISTKSPTYRKGATQQWKEIFDPGTKQLFKEVAGDALIQYGYEDNYNW